MSNLQTLTKTIPQIKQASGNNALSKLLKAVQEKEEEEQRQATVTQHNTARKEMVTAISAAIKQKRQSLGLTQRELARKCNMSQTTINRVEKYGWTSYWTLVSILVSLELDVLVVDKSTLSNPTNS